jgi:hypothetical protein
MIHKVVERERSMPRAERLECLVSQVLGIPIDAPLPHLRVGLDKTMRA